MRRTVVAALLLSACTESAPPAPCAEEAERAALASLATREAVRRSAEEDKLDSYSDEARAAFRAVGVAAKLEMQALAALDACMGREGRKYE